MAARWVAASIAKKSTTALGDQQKIFSSLIQQAKNTAFGKDHHFDKIQSYDDYKNQVPVRDYEQLRPYFDRIKDGEADVLWPGKPRYLAKTSGTTSGIKYIPVSRQSIPNHMNSARNAIFCYLSEKNNASVFNGKMIFLSGSPELETVGGIPTGRLSGIVNHEIPSWIKTNQVPSWETNCIEDWEIKLEKIIDETINLDMRVIGGIPPWVQMYFERLLERTGKSTIMDIFPNFTLFIYGGVNYEPYRSTLENLIGKKVDSIEYFPASEGFYAFQDKQQDQSLLLNTDSGIFYEFIPLENYGTKNEQRLSLEQIEADRDYALVVSNNAGLFAYDIGDVVRFTSVNPYKLLVTGRVKHFISAFGEHVIAKEVEEAIKLTIEKHPCRINEFTVAPQVSPPDNTLPYHEWLIEFEEAPKDLMAFALALDEEMVRQNIYYKDLIDGKILKPLQITLLPKASFIEYMKTQGKLGGQNKVPRLTNDRKIADALLKK